MGWALRQIPRRCGARPHPLTRCVYLTSTFEPVFVLPWRSATLGTLRQSPAVAELTSSRQTILRPLATVCSRRVHPSSKDPTDEVMRREATVPTRRAGAGATDLFPGRHDVNPTTAATCVTPRRCVTRLVGCAIQARRCCLTAQHEHPRSLGGAGVEPTTLSRTGLQPAAPPWSLPP